MYKGMISLFLIATLIITGVDTLFAEDEMAKKTITLPEPILKGAISIEEAISKRRSVRSYQDKDLTLKQVSQLLWSAQGITNKRSLRAAPSAGALYPLEVYIVKKDGLFHYKPQKHLLEPIQDKDLRQSLSSAAWGQAFVAQAPIDIVICAVYERITSKYNEKGIRYTDMEAGHAAENIHLQAVALGLDSVPVGAFNEKDVSSVLGLPEEEIPIYIVPVGYRK